MPINMVLLFVCGVLLGLLLNKKRTTSRAGESAAGEVRRTPFEATMTHIPVAGSGASEDEDAFAPQLANLQIALGNSRTPGRAYSAARAAGILR